jgi:hypothetical protein
VVTLTRAQANAENGFDSEFRADIFGSFANVILDRT